MTKIDLTQMNTDAALLKFVKDYLDGATNDGAALNHTNTEFARGYVQGLRTLRSVLINLEKSAKGE